MHASMRSRSKRDDAHFLQRLSIKDAISLLDQKRKNRELKLQEMQSFIGTRYKDLIASADKIAQMHSAALKTEKAFREMPSQWKSLNTAAHSAFMAPLPQPKESDQRHVTDGDIETATIISAIDHDIWFLVTVPEKMWQFLDNAQTYEALELYLQSETIYHSKKSQASLRQYPFLENQWSCIHMFRKRILTFANRFLACKGRDSSSYAKLLVTTAILDPSRGIKSLSLLFLKSRSVSVTQDFDALDRIKQMRHLEDEFRNMLLTVTHIYQVFLNDGDLRIAFKYRAELEDELVKFRADEESRVEVKKWFQLQKKALQGMALGTLAKADSFEGLVSFQEKLLSIASEFSSRSVPLELFSFKEEDNKGTAGEHLVFDTFFKEELGRRAQELLTQCFKETCESIKSQIQENLRLDHAMTEEVQVLQQCKKLYDETLLLCIPSLRTIFFEHYSALLLEIIVLIEQEHISRLQDDRGSTDLQLVLARVCSSIMNSILRTEEICKYQKTDIRPMTSFADYEETLDALRTFAVDSMLHAADRTKALEMLRQKHIVRETAISGPIGIYSFYLLARLDDSPVTDIQIVLSVLNDMSQTYCKHWAQKFLKQELKSLENRFETEDYSVSNEEWIHTHEGWSEHTQYLEYNSDTDSDTLSSYEKFWLPWCETPNVSKFLFSSCVALHRAKQLIHSQQNESISQCQPLKPLLHAIFTEQITLLLCQSYDIAISKLTDIVQKSTSLHLNFGESCTLQFLFDLYFVRAALGYSDFIRFGWGDEINDCKNASLGLCQLKVLLARLQQFIDPVDWEILGPPLIENVVVQFRKSRLLFSYLSMGSDIQEIDGKRIEVSSQELLPMLRIAEPISRFSLLPYHILIGYNPSHMSMTPSQSTRKEGEKVWCPDSRNVWQIGTIVEDNGEKLHIVITGTEEEQQFRSDEIHPFDPTHALDLENLSEMDNLHQAPLLDLLRRRYLFDKIYTYTGNILISINPYKTIPMLYNFPQSNIHEKQENPIPHVYSTAHEAYQALTNSGTCQSILISGESGAGKTEASKYIMQYLANISEFGKRGAIMDRSIFTHTSGMENVKENVKHRLHEHNPINLKDNLKHSIKRLTKASSSVEQCVLHSNPILEAFGNAKTIRNDNSSRFGKFIKIFYNADGTIIGASTSHFLLEKSRIVGCAESERNYHIFYQLCAGVTAEEKEMLKLGSANEYFYLNQGNCVQCAEINDKKDFKNVTEAMETIGIPKETCFSVFTLVAIVLKLGNIEFYENARLESCCKNSKEIEELSSLMQVKPLELEFALTKRTVSAGTRGSVAEICLNATEAVQSRNGLAKDIFSKLFDWLVLQINTSTHQFTGEEPFPTKIKELEAFGQNTHSKFIGILDIFGFEILQSNSFEQLCINYANEMLQHQFNQHVFVYEQQVYVDEGIDFSRLEFKDNTPCLELIDKKPVGILPLLDEQAMLGRRASDNNFLLKLHQTHIHPNKTIHPTYYSKPRFANDQFIIHHYAGQVTYTIAGFLEKNDDSLHNDLIALVHSSKLEFLRHLYPNSNVSMKKATSFSPITALSTRSGHCSSQQYIRKRNSANRMTGTMTVGRKFREQMADLMSELQATTPSFIRCVKPNNLRFPQGWNAPLILDQLIYLGVMETVRIRRSGYPVRRLFREFYQDYIVLTKCSKLSKAERACMTDKELCRLILQYIEPDNWQLGHKKVFLRDGQLRLLDGHIRRVTFALATKLQKHVRGSAQRQRYLRSYRLIVHVQANVRKYNARRRFIFLQRQFTLLHALVRTFINKRFYVRMRKSAIKIQSLTRGRAARKFVWYLIHRPIASNKIGATFRMYKARKTFQKKVSAAIFFQSTARMWKMRKRFRRAQAAASVIAAMYKGLRHQWEYALQKKSALKLHACGRGYLARAKYGKSARLRALRQEQAQIEISRFVRGFLIRNVYRKALKGIIILQACIRANKVRAEFLRGKRATITSQSMIRRVLVRRRFLHEKKMAVRIQSFGRMVISKQRYLNDQRSIISCQAFARMQLARWKYRSMTRQLISLQAFWRMHTQRKAFHHIVTSLCVMQKFARGMVERVRFQRRKAAVITIQASMRLCLTLRYLKRCQNTAIRIQALTRMQYHRRRYLSILRRIVKIQSLLRRKLAIRYASKCRLSLSIIQRSLLSFITRARLRHDIQTIFLSAFDYDVRAVSETAQSLPFLLRVRDQTHAMMSLLHVATQNGDLNLARFLLEENPNMEDLAYAKDAYGNTPLHYACQLAHLDMVHLLAKAANRHAGLTTCTNGASGTFSDLADRRTSSTTTEDMMLEDPTDIRSKWAFDNNVSLRSYQSSMSNQHGHKAAMPMTKCEIHPAKRRPRRMLVTSTPTAGLRRLPSFGPQSIIMPEIQVLKEGYLRKASGSRWATKRYVIIDQVCLSYYKTASDKIPLKILELCDTTIQRASYAAHCFEICSARLQTCKNVEGILSFVADTEADVLEWMIAIRKVKGVRVATSISPFQNMICIDKFLRREYVNLTNNAGFTPLHSAVQNDDEEGFEAAKVCVWLIEAGADINAADVHGETALHHAVALNRYDIVETLMKKGAHVMIKNNRKMTPIELAEDDEMRELLEPLSHASKSWASGSLLPAPARLSDSTYLSVFIAAVAVASGPIMETPHFYLYTLDHKGNTTDMPQETPKSLIQSGGFYWWFGNTWHLQHPLEHLTEGSVGVMELRYKSLVTNEDQVGCWTFFRLDIGSITSAAITFEMYAPPVNPFSKILARVPGDSFLQADIDVVL